MNAAATAGTLSQRLAQHVTSARYEDLPADAVDAAKRFMLDTLAVAWAGSNAPGCDAARAVALEDGGRGDSTVWAYGDRLPASACAFLNSMFAAALDFDSMARGAPTHVNIVVLPAALAIAERTHASGRAFLTALAVGCDLMYRLAASCEAQGEPHRGWFYTSVHGGIAAAAACASLLKLSAAQTANAIGIACAQAAGTQQANIEPSLAKRMQSAFAARSGVFSALLAAKDVTSPQEAIEGRYGLFAMYQKGDAERLLDRLGERYENGELSIKKYPSCGCNHTAIEGTLDLVRKHALTPEDIEHAEVEISPFMDRLVGGRFEPGTNPQAAAQFNIRYSIACAIRRGRFGLAELDDAVIHDPQIARLIERIDVKVDPDNCGSRGPMVLRVRSRRHGALSSRVEHEPGSSASPLSDAEVQEKARACFALGAGPLDVQATERLLKNIAAIEREPDMAAFVTGLHQSPPSPTAPLPRPLSRGERRES